MANSARAISGYSFTSSDVLFFDANVWLYIYGPQAPRDWKSRKYSAAFRNILNARSKIYIDVLIMSEFINRYSRLKHSIIAPESDFKNFRASTAFKVVANEIAGAVKNILQFCVWTGTGFDLMNIESILNRYASGESDFNDLALIDLCKRNKWTMVTHDRDFKNADIPILTANSQLIAS